MPAPLIIEVTEPGRGSHRAAVREGLVLGRGPTRELRLGLRDRAASRRHAGIVRNGERWELSELEARNPVRILREDETWEPCSRFELRPGVEFIVGREARCRVLAAGAEEAVAGEDRTEARAGAAPARASGASAGGEAGAAPGGGGSPESTVEDVVEDDATVRRGVRRREARPQEPPLPAGAAPPAGLEEEPLEEEPPPPGGGSRRARPPKRAPSAGETGPAPGPEAGPAPASPPPAAGAREREPGPPAASEPPQAAAPSAPGPSPETIEAARPPSTGTPPEAPQEGAPPPAPASAPRPAGESPAPEEKEDADEGPIAGDPDAEVESFTADPTLPSGAEAARGAVRVDLRAQAPRLVLAKEGLREAGIDLADLLREDGGGPGRWALLGRDRSRAEKRGGRVDREIPEGTLSSPHAAVGFHEGRFFVKDLGSRNGTRIRGRGRGNDYRTDDEAPPLDANRPYELSPETWIELGGTLDVLFCRAPDPAQRERHRYALHELVVMGQLTRKQARHVRRLLRRGECGDHLGAWLVGRGYIDPETWLRAVAYGIAFGPEREKQRKLIWRLIIGFGFAILALTGVVVWIVTQLD